MQTLIFIGLLLATVILAAGGVMLILQRDNRAFEEFEAEHKTVAEGRLRDAKKAAILKGIQARKAK